MRAFPSCLLLGDLSINYQFGRRLVGLDEETYTLRMRGSAAHEKSNQKNFASVRTIQISAGCVMVGLVQHCQQ